MKLVKHEHNMYRLGEPLAHYHKRIVWVVVIAVVLVTVIAFLLVHYLVRANMAIGPTPPATTTSVASGVATKTLDEPLFTIALPTDWQLAASMSSPSMYRFVATAKPDNARWLDVYVDSVPNNFAMNRMLPVQANGTGITVIGTVSDNCVNFTGPGVTVGSGTAPAKWEGITFTCDTGNYIRDVVGIGTGTADNSVALTSTDKGTHKFYFVYTDNDASADYTLFTSALKTFQLK